MVAPRPLNAALGLNVKVLAIGTDHSAQFGVFGVMPELGTALERLLAQELVARRVDLVAEEMSAEALAQVGADVSVPQRVAVEFGVAHMFVDPDRSERQSLGIASVESLKHQAFMDDWSAQQLESAIQEQYRLRERAWLARLHEARPDSMLFVCGENHLKSFVDLLSSAGHIVEFTSLS